MNLLNELISRSWSEALVWTLIHSLWEGLLIVTLLHALLRIIPSRYSVTRYGASLAALLCVLAASIGTFIYLTSTGDQNSREYVVSVLPAGEPFEITKQSVSVVEYLTHNIQAFISSNVYWITLVWMVGAFLFSLRIAGGFLYISTVKRNASVLSEEWDFCIQQLSAQINLHKKVILAESSGIQVPFVIGFIKPMILIPAGMIARLSPDQMEAILIHELMHIKRNDYLVNILQSVIESILFFNPFVWVISSSIRAEREHCCDDAVVKQSNAIAYARALAQLEELKLAGSPFVLSLAANKNQLLKRIKRIMEKSVQNYSLKERVVPFVLLIVGLACASWLSITSPASAAEQDPSLQAASTIVSDTTKPKKKESRSTKQYTVRDREGNIIEASVTVEEGEDVREALEELLSDSDVDFHAFFDAFAVPAIPPMEPREPVEPFAPFMAMPPMEPMTPFSPLPPMPPVGFSEFFYMDTIPGEFFKHGQDWENFSEEFQTQFKEKFGDFYKKHGEEMEKMMKESFHSNQSTITKRGVDQIVYYKKRETEMGAQFKNSFNHAGFERAVEELAHQHKAIEQQIEIEQEALNRQHKDEQSMHQRELLHEERARQDEIVQQQRELAMHQREREKEMLVREESMKRFEKELTEELVKDGYIGKDDAISSMHWSSDGIEINNKKIKKEHQKKYSDIHYKHFKMKGTFHYVK